LARKLRADGKTFAEIAEILRGELSVSARAAMRLAHSWTQQQAAEQWGLRWPDRPKDKKWFSYQERWPNGGRPPSLDDLHKLAQLYQCALADLLTDLDYQDLDLATNAVEEPARASSPVEPTAVSSSRSPGRDGPGPSGSPMVTATSGTEGVDEAWRVGDGTVADLEVLVGSYRRAYAGTAGVAELLPVATGLMHVLTDLGRRDRWSRDRARLASLVGQTAVLAGLLRLMGDRDLDAARKLYNLALRSAYDAEDWDLASYVLGSLAFEAVSGQRPADARALRDAAWNLASQRATPRTTAWVAALGSELHARDGDEVASCRLLADAYTAIAQTRDEPSWKGVGWFDEARLDAYEGGNLVLLGRYDAAAQRLRRSLARLDAARLKHRCTLSADLAMALVHLGEIDEASERASDALTLATAISHQESVDRVRRAHTHLLRWGDHPGVLRLTERLEAV
jgi:transcriptional regulator with XRE-family HTH domain